MLVLPSRVRCILNREFSLIFTLSLLFFYIFPVVFSSVTVEKLCKLLEFTLNPFDTKLILGFFFVVKKIMVLKALNWDSAGIYFYTLLPFTLCNSNNTQTLNIFFSGSVKP